MEIVIESKYMKRKLKKVLQSRMIITKVRRKTERLLLLCIIMVTLFLRLYELDSVPSALFVDEVWSVYQPYLHQSGLVDLSPYSVASYFLQGTYFVYQIFGSSILFTRLSVAIYGTLFVVAIYFLAKEMFNSRIGLLSALLMALCPWAMIFSRYQVPSISSVFWSTLAIYLIYKGSKLKHRKKAILIGLGSLALGLSLNTIAVLRIFIPLFSLGFVALAMKNARARICTKTILNVGSYFTLFLLGAFPLILDYVVYPSSAGISRSEEYSTFFHASTIFDLGKLVGERLYLHLSPDFLLLTGGFSFAGAEGFHPMISAKGLLKYSTGAVGMLNYYGILIYPAICYLVYKTARKKSTIEERLLLWWIFSYLLTSTISYYDNPNAARNIIGLPALIIAIAVFIDRIHALMNTSSMVKKPIRLAFTLGIVMIILLPTIYFSIDYFAIYPARSARSFDYGYKEITQFLTETDNWKRPIFLYSLPNRNWNLAFYSPQQPIKPDKFRVVDSNFSFAALFPQGAFIQIEKSLTFVDGTIKYNTRIDQGYGAATFSQMQLARDENNIFALSIYAKNSTLNPNGYSVVQKVDGQVYAEQRSLNKVIEYTNWYTVELMINSTSVSFCLDNELITTWSRPTNDVYHYLRLCGESGGVSFTDFKIMYSGDNEFINIINKAVVSDWQMISGAWVINQNIIHGDASIILIVPSSLNLQPLLENNVKYKILKTIYYPAGDVAFRVLLVTP